MAQFPGETPSPPLTQEQMRATAIKSLLTIIKSAELYMTRNGRSPEAEGLAVDTGINALLTLGVETEEMREQIKKLGW